MKKDLLSNGGLLLLAIIFSAGLFFAFIELPRLLDSGVQRVFGFPQFDQGLGDVNALKTEMFIQGLHLRWIGYGSLAVILALIFAGFTSSKTGWAVAGAVGLFIPVFGEFALSMFFLAGLGFLRVEWLPFMDIHSFNVLDLGRVIYVPFWILMWLFGLFKWNAQLFLFYFFMAAGALLFTWGVLVWFQSRYRGQQVASVWIYRISRHPQYLGWILWSYGFILFTPSINQMKKTWSVSSSLPWLLMTMTIVGICMMEEIRMSRVSGGGYDAYRNRTPFLFPLPAWLSRIIGWPARRITGGDYPDRPRQVWWITLLYTVILISLSLFWVDLRPNREMKESGEEARQELAEIVTSLERLGEDRRDIYSRMEKIPRFGAEGTGVLMELATHDNPVIREFAVQLLGKQNYLPAETLYLTALNDSVKRVRSSAIEASGILNSERAADSLIRLLTEPKYPNNLFLVYRALGSVGRQKSIPYLAAGLEGQEWYNQQAALNAIMEINPESGVEYAIRELKDQEARVRQNAVIQCILSDDPRVIEPLGELFKDKDFEVRFYARQGVKRLQALSANGPPGTR